MQNKIKVYKDTKHNKEIGKKNKPQKQDQKKYIHTQTPLKITNN